MVDTEAMGLEPSVEEQELLAQSIKRAAGRMSRRELIVELLSTATFFGLAGLLWLSLAPRPLLLVPGLLCWVTLVLAMSVRFETPFGFTVPTQLAFVPLLFTLPLAAVPVAVATALVAARIPDVFKGEVEPRRLIRAAGVNGWFAYGPVATFALAQVQPSHAGPALLAVALASQFAVDFAISSLLLTLETGARLGSQLGDAWIYVVDAGLSGVGLVAADQIRHQSTAVLAIVPLLGLLAFFARERHHRLQNLFELNSAYRGTALVLGDVVEADDGYTGVHSKSVVQLCLEVGELLGLDADSHRNLEFGALLHDVGKIAIAKEIINKPGKLDPEEWTIIKTHTTEGQKMLERVGGFMRDVGRIVRSHHERWDGSGYPDGLAGEEIPLESRIIACCDTWNAMRTDRSYRRALSFEVAMEELVRCAGTQLDPRVVQVLRRVVTAHSLEKTSAIDSAAAPAPSEAGAIQRVP